MLQQRIKEIRLKKGYTVEEWSKFINVPVSTINNYERGQRKISIEYIEKISTHLNINTNWLLTGEGEMTIQHPIKTDILYFPFYDVEAATGCGCYVDNKKAEGYVPFNKYYVKNILNLPLNSLVLGSISIICVRDDSMEPTLKNGDMVMIAINSSKLKEGIYVIKNLDTIQVKRLQPLGESIVRVSSDNKKYNSVDIDITKQEIDIVGKVVWFGRKVY